MEKIIHIEKRESRKHFLASGLNLINLFLGSLGNLEKIISDMKMFFLGSGKNNYRNKLLLFFF